MNDQITAENEFIDLPSLKLFFSIDKKQNINIDKLYHFDKTYKKTLDVLSFMNNDLREQVIEYILDTFGSINSIPESGRINIDSLVFYPDSIELCFYHSPMEKMTHDYPGCDAELSLTALMVSSTNAKESSNLSSIKECSKMIDIIDITSEDDIMKIERNLIDGIYNEDCSYEVDY